MDSWTNTMTPHQSILKPIQCRQSPVGYFYILKRRVKIRKICVLVLRMPARGTNQSSYLADANVSLLGTSWRPLNWAI